MIPQDLRYSQEHEWAKIDGDQITVGITDFAQEQLGEVTFVELPVEGQKIKSGDSMGAIESSKAASDVFSPVSGTISQVNSELEDAPELLNDACYEGGWICKIQFADAAQLDKLMDAKAYDQYLKGL
jgi:glycine cleavage system H protein